MQFLTEYSLWLAIPCLLLGFGYAYFLYQKKAPWGKGINRLLFGSRWLLVSFVCFLLLGPFTKLIKRYSEKPAIVLAIDNSQSLPLVKGNEVSDEIKSKLTAFAKELGTKDFDLDIQTFSGSLSADSLSNLTFNAPSTDLSGLLKGIQAKYENKNLAGVVLLSDGIYNQGTSPNYVPFTMPVYAVGVGDTTPQIDLNLKTVYANKIAYLGNQFPLVAEVYNTGFEGKKAQVRLLRKGKVLATKSITFDLADGFQTVEFLTTADEKGMQHYVLQVLPLSDEFTQKNNTKNIYIDVLDAKEKILLIAASPHPDIKAIRSAIEKNANYALDVYIPALSELNKKNKINFDDKYDVVILHQMPDLRNNGSNVINKFIEKKTPIWFITGRNSNLTELSKISQLISIPNTRQIDLVTPLFNQNFSKFTFSDENQDLITQYPPVRVPFGNMGLGGKSEVLLHQRVGSVGTDKPLWVIGETNDAKQAVLLGEGIWQWRLQEFSLNKSQEAFDDLVSKTIQYLSTKEDKRKFRVYPASTEFFDSEAVTFETEVYNNIYERIYGQKIELTVKNESGESNSYNYVNALGNSRFNVSGLPQGIYTYSASTVLDGKKETSSGRFTIKALELEALNTKADFNLLRNLAKQTEGSFQEWSNWETLTASILATEYPSIIHSQEEFEELLNLDWLLWIMIALASIEWFLRKFKGGY